MTDALVPILVATLAAGTPLVFAALGELVAEKSGVLNLGVEGMMLCGAIAGFAATVATGNAWIGVLAGMGAGAATALVFAVLTLTLQANQVAAGLALSIFGVGLSAFAGKPFESVALPSPQSFAIPVLSDIPLVGPVLFAQQPLVYLSWALFGLVSWFLYRSRPGLVLRAVGESPTSANAIAGVGGAYLSVIYTPMWVENMTAGRGWIALALVVFATWRPGRVLVGAYLFGGVTIAQFFAQGAGAAIASQLLSSLPYLATIVVLVLISRNPNVIRLNAPVSLGKSYHPDG
jgi:simple sugar transport system permease protein